MPVVFVHGVNNRKENPSYRAGTIATEAFLKRHLEGASINGKTLETIDRVYFPYWGDLGTSFTWEMASLPTGEMEALGSSGDAAIEPLAAHLWDGLEQPVGDEPLAQLAKQDFGSAADIVVELLLSQAREGDEAEAAAFAVAVSAYASAHPKPDWVDDAETDNQFIADLHDAITEEDGHEAMGGGGGLFSAVRKAAGAVKKAAKNLAGSALDSVGDFASTRVLGASRTSLNQTLGYFFGDIFHYFAHRGTKDDPGPIPTRVLASFDEALANAPAGEPFVIIGHSLGGVITFDLLSHFRPDLKVDLFVSVGSQVAHFEEIKLYRESDKDLGPPQKASRPTGIARWINVYDEVDVFAYAANGVFGDVDEDLQYNTGTYVIKAHGAYFKQNRFYERLRARINNL